MPSAVLYSIAASLQVIVSIAVLGTNAWMVNRLIIEPGLIIDTSSIGWASFYILMTMAILSVVVHLIQALVMCCCIGPLSRNHYMVQAVYLILQMAGWLAAAAWGTFVLLNNDIFLPLFGNVEYVAITCSWVAPFLALVMIVLVLRLRSARAKTDMEAHLHHSK